MTDEERVNLKIGEPHPSAINALTWVKNQPIEQLMQWQSAYASCAISGNRLAEICGETLRRLLNGEPVSDRYLLGLAWSMRDNGEADGSGSTQEEGGVRAEQGEGSSGDDEGSSEIEAALSDGEGEEGSDQKGEAVDEVPKA